MAEPIVLAIDPGVTTGFALYKRGVFHQYQFDAKKYSNPHLNLYDHLSEVRPELILYEAFYFRQAKTGAVYLGVEFIGVIEYWAQNNGAAIKKMSPAKEFWTDDTLESVGLYLKALGHAMDATRLLCTWLKHNNEEWYTEALVKIRNNA